MRLQDQLTEAIADQVSSVPVPPPDLTVVRRRGRARRRPRTAAVVAGVAAACCGAVLLGQAFDGAVVQQAVPGPNRDPQRFEPVGALDYSRGLRAFASPDPDGQLSLGGRLFPVRELGYLDTDASATPYGLVFFDQAWQAHLLREDGTDVPLAPAPSASFSDFRASSKADAQLPLVAFTQPDTDGVRVVLHDLRAGNTVDTLQVPCSGSDCQDVVVDGVDSGLVFVRTAEGTYVWDPAADGDASWTLLGAGEFRVADVRNQRILWASSPPSPAPNSPVAAWDLTEGAIDAQLSFDGGHVLYWSRTLQPTTPDGSAITLDVQDAQFFTFDTDGSVLAASSGGLKGVFYDCVIPSGSCTEIGTLTVTSGDPVFIGNDM
jgi:hypothetical protein